MSFGQPYTPDWRAASHHLCEIRNLTAVGPHRAHYRQTVGLRPPHRRSYEVGRHMRNEPIGYIAYMKNESQPTTSTVLGLTSYYIYMIQLKQNILYV